MKSASQRVIKVQPHDVNWVKELQLPILIASVDLNTTTIEVFTTHRLSQVLLETAPPQIHLDLDQIPGMGFAHMDSYNDCPFLFTSSRPAGIVNFRFPGSSKFRP